MSSWTAVFLIATFPSVLLAIDFILKEYEDNEYMLEQFLAKLFLVVWIAVAAVQLQQYLKGLA